MITWRNIDTMVWAETPKRTEDNHRKRSKVDPSSDMCSDLGMKPQLLICSAKKLFLSSYIYLFTGNPTTNFSQLLRPAQTWGPPHVLALKSWLMYIYIYALFFLLDHLSSQNNSQRKADKKPNQLFWGSCYKQQQTLGKKRGCFRVALHSKTVKRTY